MAILGKDALVEAFKAGDIVYGNMPDPKKNKDKFADWVSESVSSASLDVSIGQYLYTVQASAPQEVAQVQFRQQLAPVDSSMPGNEWLRLDLEKTGNNLLVSPGHTVLAHSQFPIYVSEKYAAQILVRSTANRWGWQIPVGYIDPGFSGYLAIPLHNGLNRHNRIFKDAPYAQLVFYEVTGAVEYTGKYQTQDWSKWEPKDILPRELKGLS